MFVQKLIINVHRDLLIKIKLLFELILFESNFPVRKNRNDLYEIDVMRIKESKVLN